MEAEFTLIEFANVVSVIYRQVDMLMLTAVSCNSATYFEEWTLKIIQTTLKIWQGMKIITVLITSS